MNPQPSPAPTTSPAPASPPPTPRGPRGHRLLIWVCSSLLGLLAFWLLGFVLEDIGSWRGPDYATVEARHLPPGLREQEAAVREQIATLKRAVQDDREQRQSLSEGAANAQTTMRQMLDIQQLSLEKGIAMSEEERRALAESEQLFLEAQRRYQAINARIATNQVTLREQEARQRDLARQLEAARAPARAEHTQLQRAHNLRQAALKLAVLLPLLALVGWGIARQRGSLIAPTLYLLSAAVLVRVLLVMHEHFPTRFFKYILILAAMALVGWVLRGLVRTIRRPRREWLLKQYREAYEKFLCPICQYPIRRGPHRFLFWTRRSLRRLTTRAASGSGEAPAEEPYTCPVCATRLFEPCPACRGIRHTLLPACEHCGASPEAKAD